MNGLFTAENVVLGIGNIILSDEGFGVRVVEYLEKNFRLKNHFAQKISAHEVGIQDVLTMLELSGKKIPHVELIGAQPFSLEAGVELTEPMKELVPLFADKAVEILKSWGLEVQR